ncbi:MAG: hypothetical protein E7667_06580 [Ruminococcaceae bacterium]|nr:hypothetical protein [Oscillospiraceae bacterium]
MKNIIKIFALILALAMLAGCFAACDGGDNKDDGKKDKTTEGPSQQPTEDPGETETPELTDFAAQVKFNPNSGRVNAEVTVHAAIDGDTTHFNVPSSIVPTGILKARYLGINTPESTGLIEPWGKKASNYTKETLAKATSIYIESDNTTWNVDSTGGRYLVWVWYKTAEMTEYRNLNIEILQQGLAFGSNAADNAYSEYTMAALNQAKANKLYVFSKDEDPDFYYGGAYSVTLKELKTNYDLYKDKLVRFEGNVVKRSGATIYLEEYDPETDMYFGMQVFCGYNTPGIIMDAMKVGNRIVMVGTLQYYELGGTYQISNLQYDIMDPTGEDGVHQIGDGYVASYSKVSASDIVNGKLVIDITTKDENGEDVITPTTFNYGELAHYSTALVEDLTVKSIYTTTNEESDSNGAMSITCESADGVTITVRTVVLRDENNEIITEDAFPIGSNITVKGIIDSFNGEYQLKLFSMDDVTFN